MNITTIYYDDHEGNNVVIKYDNGAVKYTIPASDREVTSWTSLGNSIDACPYGNQEVLPVDPNA
jgi:NADH dehydrogenase/NADH:ubiquinone oxidoreductase subunit G